MPSTAGPGAVDHARYGACFVVAMPHIRLLTASVLPGTTTFHTKPGSTRFTGWPVAPGVGVADEMVPTDGVVVASLSVGGLLDVAANRLARDALSASAGGSDDTADELAGRAARLRPDSIAYRMTAVRVLLDADTLRTTDAALGQADEAVRWSAPDPIAVDLRATSLLQRALQTGSAADTAAAVAAWQVLVERDPHRGRWQLQLGIAAAAAGDNALARQAWQRAEALGQARATQLLEELP